jgi:predicted DNA-binding protein (MmcQ/YjbR family)
MAAKTPLQHMREICLSLPGTKETLTWGQPHFRVGEKIFSGIGDEKGKAKIGFKLEMDHADAIIQDPRFERAPYVGHKGWVSMDVAGVRDWEEVRALVMESYRLIAPKRLLAQLAGGAGTPAAAPARGAGRKAPARRNAATRSRSRGTGPRPRRRAR